MDVYPRSLVPENTVAPVPRRCDFEHLVASDARTECPYKGRTTPTGRSAPAGKTHADLAWSYAFPTRQLLPIAGLVAFLKKVDVFIDGVEQQRPSTHMS